MIFKRQYVIAIIIILLIGICAGFSSTAHKKGIVACANEYFSALCDSDIERAKTQATGQALWTLANIQELPKATIEKANIKVVSSNKQWAKAKVITEVRLSDGTLDVNWNDIELTNTDQGWKIYIVKPYVPEFNSGIILNNETDNLKSVFEEYLNTTSSKYLVGQLRVAQEQNQVKLNPVEYKDLEISFVAGNKDYRLVKASYRTERNVQLYVTFYNSIDGWKIANIQQI